MTPIEAYNFTMDKVEELEKADIGVIIIPYKFGDNIDELEKESENNINGIPLELWQKIKFVLSNSEEANIVHKAANYLGLCGIKFDVGGDKDTRDWELDWSFEYTGTEDTDWRDARDDCEDQIRNS